MEMKEVPVEAKDLKEGDRVVALNGKSYRVTWLRQFESVTMFRQEYSPGVHRLVPHQSVKIRVKA